MVNFFKRKVVRIFNGHTKSIRSLKIYKNDLFLISCSFDTLIKIWSIISGQNIKTFSGHKGCVRSIAILSDYKTIISGGEDCTIKIWSTGNEVELYMFKSNEYGTFSVAISE